MIKKTTSTQTFLFPHAQPFLLHQMAAQTNTKRTTLPVVPPMIGATGIDTTNES